MSDIYLSIGVGETAPDRIIMERKGKQFKDTYVFINDTKQATRKYNMNKIKDIGTDARTP